MFQSSNNLCFTNVCPRASNYYFVRVYSDTGATQVSVGNNTDPAGDEGNIQQEQLSHHFLDSPSSTSEVTYKWQTRTFNSGRVIYVGRTADVSDGNRATAPTNITLMEILQ